MYTEREIERVVEIYSDMLLRIAMHHVNSYAQAEDIVQDVFLKFITKSPTFVDENHEKAWLLRVTINECKDIQRHWWNKKQSEYLMDHVSDKEQLNDESKYSFVLLEEIKKLPFHYRNAIYLFYYEGLSTKQIAQICKVREGTVSSWLHRGKKSLKSKLQGGGIYE